ncbi:MAG: tRNA/rRNA methyltransferase [Chlamydiae bacterium]|nr:tRNA/rRNA methyltransferase [Chlamydiota bacterium]
MKKTNHQKEIKYYGIHACLAIADKRPKDIIKIYIDSSNIKTFKEALKWCSDNKKAYHIVTNADLDKVSGSVHHEGVCIVAKESVPMDERSFIKTIESSQKQMCILYFDGVQNPHNIGSIIRTCAHFNVQYILGSKEDLPALSPSACRIAKGGAEIVQLVKVENPVQFMKILKNKGFHIVSTSSHVKDSLYDVKLPSRMVLALGSEANGVSKDILSFSSMKVQIPGSGLVESLNVSVATSLFLGEFYRQHVRQAC